MSDFGNLFRNLLSDEQRAKLDAAKFREARERQETKALSDEELADKAERYMSYAFGLRRIADDYRDSPVYDTALWYVVFPEIIERLRGQR